MLTEIVSERALPWRLMAAPTGDPAWVGWIHDGAAGWMAEVLRRRDAGRAAGLEIEPLRDAPGVQATRHTALATHTATPALWAVQVEHTRALVEAIGQLARAINTPIPSFAPWAEGLLYRDRGAGPTWEGWGYTSPGEWRYSILERVQAADAHVRDAVASGHFIFDSLAHRVGLSVEGLPNVTYLQGLAPTQMAGHAADYHQSDCGVVGAAPSGWSCIDWSVWEPGFGSAETNTLMNAILPLGWQWELAVEVANAIEALGTVERLVSSCRAWVNVQNTRAVNYMQNVLGLNVGAPEDILTQQARDQAARFRVPDSARITAQIGARAVALITNPYVAAAIAIATALPEILYPIFGQAQGYAVDVWGQRDPAVAVTAITGTIDMRHPRPPTHSVAPSPAPPAGFPTLTAIPVADVIEAVRQRPLATRKKSSAAVPLALGAALLLLAK